MIGRVTSTDTSILHPESSEQVPIAGRLPALDGIRGIAVVVIMFFHFGWTGIPGSYLAIDVFFVLSGFLITMLLLREHQRTSHVNFGQFWARRARRLFPGLSIMLVAVAIGCLFFSPLEQLNTFRQGIATLAYSNNWYLIFTDTLYFSDFQNASPLLHTWSLAVEEQWYLVFPLALVLLLWKLRSRPGRLTFILLGLAVVSAGWGTYLTVTGASVNRLYLGTDVRAQELLLGAALATAMHHGPWRQWLKDRFGQHVVLLSAIASIVIIAMFLFAHEEMRWQYAIGLFGVSTAVAVIMWSVIEFDTSLRRFLAWQPFAYLGLISYGLYLWHWPMFIWFSDPQQPFGPAKMFAVLVLTGTATVLSYYLFELPVRARKWSWTSGKKGWYVAIITPLCLAAIFSAFTQHRRDVIGTIVQTADVVPAGGYYGSGPKVFILGDSMGDNLRSVSGYIPDPGFSITGSTYLGCDLIPNDLVFNGQRRPNPLPCSTWAAQWPQDIVRLQPELTIIMPPSQFHDSLVDDQGNILTFGTPQFDQFYLQSMQQVVDKVEKGSQKIAILDNFCGNPAPENPRYSDYNDPTRVPALNKLNQQFLAQNPQIYPLHITDWDCGKDAGEQSRLAVERKYDGIHYNRDGALQAWAQLAPQIRPIVGLPANPQ